MSHRVSSRVRKLIIRDRRTVILLEDPEFKPKDGAFRLASDHPNYNAGYALALAAAINRYTLLITTEAEITSTEQATVKTITVAWDN